MEVTEVGTGSPHGAADSDEDAAFGVTPTVNAVATIMLALTLVAVVIAYLVLRRTEQARRQATIVPAV